MKTKRIVAVLAMVLAGCVLAFTVLLAGVSLWLKVGYWFDEQPIKKGFAAIPGCTLISVTGNEDTSLEHITAKVHVHGKGTLILSELGPGSFRQTGEMRLHQIGNLGVRRHSYGHHGVYMTATGEPVKSSAYSTWVDIGDEGPFADILPFRIQRVQDVVRHYDEVFAALAHWPREPEAMSIVAKDGMRHEVCIVLTTESEQQPLSPR